MFKRRQKVSKTTETLTVGDGGILEVPRRTPLDWRDNPIGPGYGRTFVEADAQWLDHIFQLLHQHSPTFRALINTNSYCAGYATTLTPFESHDGAVNKRYGEIDIHQKYLGDDLSGLWMASHEYRHLWQESRKANIFMTLMKFADYDALNFAVEADANAFAATCLYEVVTGTGRSLNEATSHFEKTALHHIWQKFLNAADGSRETAAFEAFLEKPNTHILESYRQKLRTAFSTVAGTKNVDQEYFHITSNGGVYLVGPEIVRECPVNEYAREAEDRFKRLKSMSYENQDGKIIDRHYYLRDIPVSALRLVL